MSPVVFRYRNFRFQFYANEGTPREPVHIHVVAPGCDAKFWLWPDVSMAYNVGYDQRTLAMLARIVEGSRLRRCAARFDSCCISERLLPPGRAVLIASKSRKSASCIIGDPSRGAASFTVGRLVNECWR